MDSSSMSRDRPVSNEELESMPDKIGAHFDRIRDLLATKLDGDADIDE